VNRGRRLRDLHDGGGRCGNAWDEVGERGVGRDSFDEVGQLCNGYLAFQWKFQLWECLLLIPFSGRALDASEAAYPARSLNSPSYRSDAICATEYEAVLTGSSPPRGLHRQKQLGRDLEGEWRNHASSQIRDAHETFAGISIDISIDL